MIGQRLAKQFLQCDWEVTAVVRPETDEARLPSGVKRINLRMESYDRLGEQTGPCDCLVQLAWNGTRGVARMDSRQQRENLEFSLCGLQSMLHAGCERVITAGSQAEYGPYTGQITEESECHPNTEYGAAKLEFYKQTSVLCKKMGVEYKEPRFFSLYGPGDYQGTMIMCTLRDMLIGTPCELTAGCQMWDYLHIDDAIVALHRLCTMPCKDGVYNFGSGDARPLRDYIQEMAQITGSRSELRFGAIPYPETGMVSIWPDVSKLKKELGWSPKISFCEGIRSIICAMEQA